jgi:hypothetical protein
MSPDQRFLRTGPDAITEKRDGAISQSTAVSGPKELKAPPLRPAAIAPAAIEIRRFSVIAYTLMDSPAGARRRGAISCSS